MRLEMLLSCMFQNDLSIVEKSNISSDVLIVNQSNVDSILEFRVNDSFNVRMISTTERGLSKSRNMAIKNSMAEICLLVDDDEHFFDAYESNIIKAFNENPSSDVILFSIEDSHVIYPRCEKKVGYIRAMKSVSRQIAFRRSRIIQNNIKFDEEMGSGTGHGCSEENKFLFDCLKAKLKIKYVPITIASVSYGKSQWFNGFTDLYFYNRGWANRRYLGAFFSFLYALYFSFTKYRIYKNDNRLLNSIRLQLRGIYGMRKKI